MIELLNFIGYDEFNKLKVNLRCDANGFIINNNKYIAYQEALTNKCRKFCDSENNIFTGIKNNTLKYKNISIYPLNEIKISFLNSYIYEKFQNFYRVLKKYIIKMYIKTKKLIFKIILL